MTLIKHEFNKLCIVLFCYYHSSASNFLLNISHKLFTTSNLKSFSMQRKGYQKSLPRSTWARDVTQFSFPGSVTNNNKKLNRGPSLLIFICCTSRSAVKLGTCFLWVSSILRLYHLMVSEVR